MAKPKTPQPDDQAAQAAHIHPNPEPEVDPVTMADSQTDDGAATAAQQNAASGFAGPSPEEEELREQLLRATADFENYKKRTLADQGRALELARTGVILSLVPVIDNFERAFKTVPDHVAKDQWYGGVQAIKQQFEAVLKELGIEKIAAVGETFDPNLHEAITTEPSKEYDENVISEEFEAGYRLGEDVIRHAKVKVSSGKDN